MTDRIIELTPAFDDVRPSEKSKPVRCLLVVLHGILSISDRWMELDALNGSFEDIELIPQPVSYSVMGPWSLLTGLGSEKRVSLVQSRIEEVLRRTDYDICAIHCHSNGTKVFASLPEEVIATFDWIFLAGSICHMDDDSKFYPAKNRVINDCGTRDPYPLIACSLRPSHFGHTGVVGFGNYPFVDHYFPYFHSAAVGVDHFEAWLAPILRTGRIRSAPGRCPRIQLFLPNILRCFVAVLLVAAIGFVSWSVIRA